MSDDVAPNNVLFPWPTVRPGPERRRETGDVLQLARTIAGLGFFARSGQNLQKVIDGVAQRGGNVGRILLPQGQWLFRGTLVLRSPFTEIVALSPGRTLFRREGTTHTGPMVSMEGLECLIRGVRFVDASTSQPCVEATGNRSKVVECQFDTSDRPIVFDAVVNGLIRDNLSLVSRNVTEAILLDGLCDECTVRGNRIHGAAAANEIYGSDTARHCLYDGNNTGAGGNISYKGAGLGNVGDATNNKATVTVRP